MLPKPSLSFTIPSTHDHTKLDCRVYHPAGLTKPSATASSSWRRNVAVVAHPYAPLGGCYDDPIVDLVGGTLLHLGFMVATFNFRSVDLFFFFLLPSIYTHSLMVVTHSSLASQCP